MNRLSWLRLPPYGIAAAAYVIAALLLWPQPVLGLVHVGGAAVVAGVGFFVAGYSSLALFRRGAGLAVVLIRQVALLIVPLLLLTLTLIWRPNCGYPQGLLLFVLYTVPSVGLGVALAYALESLRVPFGRLWFGVIGVLVATLPVAYDLGLHPQLYTYNHVWGGVLGPLYDEELAVRPGLFFFRALTVWWAVALLLVAERARFRRSPAETENARRSGLGLLAAGLIIAATYGAAPWLGINTPAWYIQDRLGGHLELERFDIYYDPESISEGDLRVIADLHRYRLDQLSAELQVRPRHRIATYLYPSTEVKASLTGSRSTSVVPTWLPVPQIHMLEDRFHGSFAHELVHVLAREFGMPVFRASPAVGLVEGLAVALEPPSGLPGVHEQVAAGFAQRENLGVERALAAEGIAAQLRPLGFWSGRGAVSYTVMGSFVRFLLDEYGPEPVRQAYRTGRVEAAFERPVDELAAEWEAFVRGVPVGEAAARLAAARFIRPSLFERPCPHHVPSSVRYVRSGNEALRRGDAATAERAFTAALRSRPTQAALAGWATIALARGDVDEVIARLEEARDGAAASVLTRLGDAYRLAGRDEEAGEAYAAAIEATSPFNRKQRALLAVRSSLEAAAVQALLEPLATAERARHLDDVTGAAPFAAIEYAEQGDFDRAASLVEGASELPEAERLAWQSAYLHAAGAPARAAELAEASARAYRAVDAIEAAERQRDRALMLRHAAGHADTANP